MSTGNTRPATARSELSLCLLYLKQRLCKLLLHCFELGGSFLCLCTEEIVLREQILTAFRVTGRFKGCWEQHDTPPRLFHCPNRKAQASCNFAQPAVPLRTATVAKVGLDKSDSDILWMAQLGKKTKKKSK